MIFKLFLFIIVHNVTQTKNNSYFCNAGLDLMFKHALCLQRNAKKLLVRKNCVYGDDFMLAMVSLQKVIGKALHQEHSHLSQD